MLQAVGTDDVEPLLRRLCIILGSPAHEAGQRRRVWRITDTEVIFDITSAENADPVLRFKFGGKYAVYCRMRQGEADGNAASAFAKSDDGKVWLLHKGIVTLSTKTSATIRRTKAEYLENEGFERLDVKFGNKVSRWYPVACLDDKDCTAAVVGFVEYFHDLREDVRRAAAQVDDTAVPDGDDSLPEEREPSRVPPREASWKTWVEEAVSRALRKKLLNKGLSAEPFRHPNGLECDLLVRHPNKIIFELKKGNSPAHHYAAIGQLIAYRTFLELPNAKLVAVMKKDARTDFRPAFSALDIELIEFTRQEGGSILFSGLDELVARMRLLGE